ncbi:MAG: hypoxanthine phosphoribosyltransferase [Chloroflexia bacterium]
MGKRDNKSPDAAKLPDKVRAINEERGLAHLLLEEPLIVGVSGGADSLALLHILLAVRTEKARKTLHVGHLNHGFRGSDSAGDAEYVAAICREWGVSCTVRSFDVLSYAARNKLSLEDAARRARYACLGALASEMNATVVVAHTADDQAETVLMNILRGTGISGLGGMRWLAGLPASGNDPELSVFGMQPSGQAPNLYRPLLGTWREEIEEYCRRHSLRPRPDKTNLDTAYFRNRVRHELMPLLSRNYNSAAKLHLWQLAELAATEDSAMEMLVDRIWPDLVSEPPTSGRLSIRTDILVNEPEAVKRRVARRALREVAGTLEGFEQGHIETVCNLLSPAVQRGASADLPNGISVELNGNIMCFWNRDQSKSSIASIDHSMWPLMEPGEISATTQAAEIKMAEGWNFLVRVGDPDPTTILKDNLTTQFDLSTFGDPSWGIIRTRKPGDRIAPFGLSGSKSLQDLFVDAKIPREVRDRIPLLAFGDSSDILWVPGPGGRRSNHAPITHTTERVITFRFERDKSQKEKTEVLETMQEKRMSTLDPDIDHILVTSDELRQEIGRIGERISADYAGKDLLLVGVLKGAIMFMVDLARAIDLPVTIDFMAVASYGASTETSGIVRILKDLDNSIEGKHVLVVEDIIDSGLTLNYTLETLRARNPASLRVCALLNKKERRLVDVPVDYVCFDIPDEFVVGYGLDFNQIYRNLPFIGVLRPELYKTTSPDTDESTVPQETSSSEAPPTN